MSSGKRRYNSESDAGSRAIDAFGSFVRKKITERTDILELAYSKGDDVRERSDSSSVEDPDEVLHKEEVSFLYFHSNAII